MKSDQEIEQYLQNQGVIISNLVNQSEQIRLLGEKFIEWWQEGRIFLGCGNGGSAAEISHMVGEATIRLRFDDSRLPFLFINLAADSSILTAGANDLGYDEIFAHQVKACAWHMQKSGAKFVLIGVSTSGASKNILRAIEEASELGIPTVGLTCGTTDKPICQLADFSIAVPIQPAINSTQANQTANLTLWHIWFEMIATSWKEGEEGKDLKTEGKDIYSNYQFSQLSSLSSPSSLASRLLSIIQQFSGKRILECGDVMLDFIIRGKAAGLSPEAAAIKVLTRSANFTFTSGGAANCAKNFRSLGAETAVWGVIDTDHHNHPENEISFGHILKNTLEKEEISWIGESDPNRETTVKLRIEAAQAHAPVQQLVRVDLEVHDPYPPTDPEKFRGDFAAYHVGDYNKGAVTPELVEILRRQSKQRGAPLVVDPKMGEGRDYFAFYHDVTAITPNDLELAELTGKEFTEEDDLAVVQIGSDYARKLNADVVVTRGRFGCTVCPIQGEATQIKALPVTSPSVSGAGDTFAAAFTLALASGANLVEASHIAVIASHLVILKEGVAKVDLDELIVEIKRRQAEKLYPFD